MFKKFHRVLDSYQVLLSPLRLRKIMVGFVRVMRIRAIRGGDGWG